MASPKDFDELIQEWTQDENIAPREWIFTSAHVKNVMEMAWAIARDVFGILATPEMAFHLYDKLIESAKSPSGYTGVEETDLDEPSKTNN